MPDLAVTRRAVSAAQTILREATPDLIIDGKPGSYTLRAYLAAPAALREAVDKVMAALGSTGMAAENQAYTSVKAATRSGASSGSKDQTIFDLEIVPAVVREARRRNVNPAFYIGQLAAESAWGAKTPHLDDGKPSYNYGGLKWDTIQTAQKALASTSEQINGVRVRVQAYFSAFASADEFAKSYFHYLLDTSKHYPGLAKAGSPSDFASIISKGGYATDGRYYDLLVGTIKSAQRRYELA